MRDEAGRELPTPKPKIARSDGSRMAGWVDMVDRRLHVLENKRPKEGGYRYSILGGDIAEADTFPVVEMSSSIAEDGSAVGVYLDVAPITFNPENQRFYFGESGIYLITLSLVSYDDEICATAETPEGEFTATAPFVAGKAATTVAVETYAAAGNSTFWTAVNTSGLYGRFTVDWRAPSYIPIVES